MNSMSFLFILSYIIIIVLVIYLFFLLKHIIVGNFGEGNVLLTLKKIHKKYDYPYIKHIILPINKGVYTYYDAIVFGDYYIYIIEIKNHDGLVQIDTLDDWVYVDKRMKEHIITNPFYENEIKRHILNRLLDLKEDRIVEIIVANNTTNIKGRKGNNIVIRKKDLANTIYKYEHNATVSKLSHNFIEKKGNFLLSADVKNKKIRKKVIHDLIDSHNKK